MNIKNHTRIANDKNYIEKVSEIRYWLNDYDISKPKHEDKAKGKC